MQLNHYKKCINMQIQTIEAKGLGDMQAIEKVAICKEKTVNLYEVYQKLLEMEYESTCLTQYCPFYNSPYQTQINKCPWYKEEK